MHSRVPSLARNDCGMAEQRRHVYMVHRAVQMFKCSVGTCLLFGLADEFVGKAKTDVGVRTHSDGWTEHCWVVNAATNAAHIHVGVEGEQLVVWHISRALPQSVTADWFEKRWNALRSD